MENDMQQKIEQRLAELPEDVQAAIASSDFDEKVRTIGQAQGLHIDQMEALSDEVMLAMLGFVGMDDLAKGVEQQVRLDPAKAQAITDAVNKEIFLPIRESMKAWAAGKRGSAAPTAAPIPPQSSSVVMPSSAPKPSVPSSLPTTPPVSAPSIHAAPASATQPAQAPNLAAADGILSEKRVAAPAAAPKPPTAATAPATPAASPMPKVDPAQPQTYKADPYREPVE